MLQRDSASDSLVDVSHGYEVAFRDNQTYVQGEGEYRVKHAANERESRVSMTVCKGQMCQWLFSHNGAGLQWLDVANSVKPDSTTTLVVTLSDGRKLTAPRLAR